MVIKSRRMRWTGHVACMGKMSKTYKIVIEEPEGKRSCEIPRRRWENNIEMNLTETGFRHVNWIHLAQDRDGWRALLNTVMNVRVS
jgi:hypothetical protein